MFNCIARNRAQSLGEHSPKVKLEHWVHVLPPSVEVNACIEASVAKGDRAAGIREKKASLVGAQCPNTAHVANVRKTGHLSTGSELTP